MKGTLLFLALALCSNLSAALAPAKSDGRQAPAATSRFTIDAAQLSAAAATIQTNDLMRHIRALSSDAFEGRLPGTRGEEVTVNYLIDQFRRIGLQPGNSNGKWIQDVPLAGVKSQLSGALHFENRQGELQFPQDIVAWSAHLDSKVVVQNSDMVFVGYGIQAPEYQWDDFKGQELRGKTLVMLVGDPPIPDPAEPARLDKSIFKGQAMTYYGRWTYKFEMGAKLGAAAVLVIHETGPAGYPWFVVVNRWGRENFSLNRPDRNKNEVPVTGWLSLERAQKLFSELGHDYQAIKKSALDRNFKPLPLRVKASFTIENQIREVASRNVLAKLPGRDPQRSSEYVIYTAHWDHLGKDERRTGDQIFNGALDNASGAAGLLELAEAFTRLSPAPTRGVLFAAVTAEEQGLLGAKYYVEQPPYAIEKTLANLNLDVLNPWGRRRDVRVIGLGNSSLEDLLTDAAEKRGRIVLEELMPEKGSYYRSDHFLFAKSGVPALYLSGAGTEYAGQPPDFGRRKMLEYADSDYHKVTDEIKPDWDLTGAADDLQLLFEVGCRVAEEDQWPIWKADSEFKPRREEMLRRRP